MNLYRCFIVQMTTAVSLLALEYNHVVCVTLMIIKCQMNQRSPMSTCL